MALSLDELRPATAVGGAFGVLFDVVLHSGDTLIAFAIFFVETVDLWLPFLSRLSEVASDISWLPSEWVQIAVQATLLVFVLVYASRLWDRWRSRGDSTE